MNILPAGTGPSFELTPGKSYTAGSAERVALEAALDEVQGTDWDVPVMVGGREIRTGQVFPLEIPHDHALTWE